jgi:hypothetical protein
MISNSSDDIVIGISDLKRLFYKIRFQMKRVVLFCVTVTFCLLLCREPKYMAQASFKQAPQANETALRLKEMFQAGGLNSSESGTSAIMQSRTVLRDVIEEMGLQVEANSPFWLTGLLSRAWDNIAAEMGKKIADPDPFAFQRVKYDGEKRAIFYLKPIDAMSFEVYNAKKECVGTWNLSQIFSVGEFQGTLTRFPKQISTHKMYCFSVNPWLDTIEKMRKCLEVKPFKQEKLILGLTFLHRDRFLASRILNQVMQSYQKFMRKENEELMGYQRSYLEKRQNELTRKWEDSLQEHVCYLKNNLDSGGYFSLYQEMEMLSQPRKIFTSKLFDVDLELKRLQGMPVEAYTYRDPYNPQKVLPRKERDENNKTMQKTVAAAAAAAQKSQEDDPLASQNKMVVNVLEDKKQQWDRKLFALQLEHERLAAHVRPASQLQQEILELARQSEEAELILEKWENKEELPLVHDPKSLAGLWVQEIVKMQKNIAEATGTEKHALQQKMFSDRTHFSEQLRSSIQLLQHKQHALEENLLVQQGSMQEFSGLTLETAQALYLTYNTTRDNLQGQLRQLIYLSEELAHPDFELSSITTILSDPVTLAMVSKASDTAVLLRDSNNRSFREQEHLKDALVTQKKFIGHHLGQTIELLKLRAKLIDDKILSLQQTTMDLLKQEKKLIEEKLQEISGKMEDLPEKWRRENLLMLKKELGMHMIGGLTQLAETKNIDQHLFQVGSKALDPSYLPIHPKPPHLLLYLFIGTFLSALFFYFYHLCKGILRGMPVSHESLLLSGYRSLGTLSLDCNSAISEMRDQDLETLRRISQFMISSNLKHLCGVLIGGKNPDYSHRLAELLAMQGGKVLLVQYVFDAVSSHQVPGLWHYLQDDSVPLPVRHLDSYDYLPSGGTSRHGVEMLAHPKFQSFLNKVKTSYDYVLIYSKAQPHFAEAQAFLRIADLMIVTTLEEKKEDLSVFREWEGSRETPCAAFVCCDPYPV